MDFLISLTLLNYDDLEDKMKGTYELPRDLGKNETYGIVRTESGQFEVYIDLRNKQEMNDTFEKSSYHKKHPIEEWTITSSWKEVELSGLSQSVEADVSRIMFCK